MQSENNLLDGVDYLKKLEVEKSAPTLFEHLEAV